MNLTNNYEHSTTAGAIFRETDRTNLYSQYLYNSPQNSIKSYFYVVIKISNIRSRLSIAKSLYNSNLC